MACFPPSVLWLMLLSIRAEDETHHPEDNNVPQSDAPETMLLADTDSTPSSPGYHMYNAVSCDAPNCTKGYTTSALLVDLPLPAVCIQSDRKLCCS